MTSDTLFDVLKTTIVTDEYGTRYWCCVNGKLHREGGPAVEYANGNKSWYRNGKLHREDGPAIEYISGGKVWYLHGVCQHGK